MSNGIGATQRSSYPMFFGAIVIEIPSALNVRARYPMGVLSGSAHAELARRWLGWPKR